MRFTTKHLPWLKALFHLIALAPIARLLFQVLTEAVGGEPVEYIIHYTGIGALNTLLLMLLLSPIAKRFKQGTLLQTRRLIGLYVYCYATLHIAAYVSLDLLFEWSLLFEEIIKRPYIIVGLCAYFILSLLAFTSFSALKRRMGKHWQKLHNSVYLAAILITVHFYWSVKSEIIEPSIYILLTLALLALRLPKRRAQTNRYK